MSFRSPRPRLRAEMLEDRVVPSFTTPVIFTNLADGKLDNPGSVATGDLNGDGKADLAVSNYGSSGGGTKVSVFLNDGSGGFPVTPNFDLDTGSSGTSFVTIADLNGDSQNDIVALSAPSGANSQVTVFTNDGSASGFTPLTPVDSGGMAGAWLAVGDINADAKPDVVVANGGAFSLSTTGNNVVVLTNDGSGLLSNAKTLSLPVPGGAFGAGLPRGVVIGDFNGDSMPDIVVAAANPSFGSEANGTVNTHS